MRRCRPYPWLRPELAGGDHEMRNIVAVGPGDGGEHLHRELRLLECEIVDIHLDVFGRRYCRLRLLGMSDVGMKDHGRSDGNAEAAERCGYHVLVSSSPSLSPAAACR